MNIIEQIRRTFSAPSKKDITGGSALLGIQDEDRSITPQEFFLGWQYVAITTIAETVAGIEMGVLQKDGQLDTEAEDLKIFDSADGMLSRYEYFLTIATNLLLYGEYFVIKDNPTNPKFLQIPNPADMTVEGTDTELVTGYKLGESKIEKERVIWNSLYNPNDRRNGLSPLVAFDRTIKTWDELEKYVEVIASRGGQPSAILENTGEQKYGAKDVKKLQKIWKNAYGKVEKAGSVAILPRGLKYTRTGYTPAEMEVDQKQEKLRDRILGLYRVPKFLVGLTDGVNYASAKVGEYVFAKYVILPIMKKITDAHNKQMPPKKGLWGFTSPVPNDEAIDVAVKVQKLTYMTIDEVRELDGLEPLPNGEGAKLRASFSPVVPTDNGGNDNGNNQDNGGNDDNDGANNSDGTGKAIQPIKRITQPLKKKFNNRIELKEYLLKRQSKTESEYVRVLKRYFKGLEERVLKAFDEQKNYSSKALQDGLLNAPEEVSLLTKILEALGFRAIKKGNNTIERLVGQTIEIHPEMFQSMVNEVSSQMSMNIFDTTKKNLLNSLIEGLKDGETEEQLKERVREVMGQNIPRAYTIARTESNRWLNLGQFESTRQVSKNKEWVTIQDGRQRDAHGEADGQIVPVDAKFLVGGQYLLYPSEPNADPDNSINCRCSAVPALEQI